MPDHDDLPLARLVLFGQKGAAIERRRAQRLKETLRHDPSAKSLRFAFASQIEPERLSGGDDVTGLHALAPVKVVRWRSLLAFDAALEIVLPERDEPRFIAVRQVAQQHAVDDAEQSRR